MLTGFRPKSQRSQAMPEFALVAPILFLIIFGIFDFGKGIYDYVTLQTATNEAARVLVQGEPDLGGTPPYAPMSMAQVMDAASKNTAGIKVVPAPSVDCSSTGHNPVGIPAISTLSNSGSAGYIPANTGYIWVSDPQDPPFGSGTCTTFASGYKPGQSNQSVQVTIVYHYAPITPLIGSVIGNHIFLTIFSVYRTEY